ncbi:MAG: TonB-dependent receptor [Steroidobacteraceae bacterium]
MWLLASAVTLLACIPQARAGSTPSAVPQNKQNVPQNKQNIESLQTIEIEATRISRQDAVLIKMKAPNIIEVQPLEEMKKLPDRDIAEALQRIPGVSMETDSGAGRFVEIRGMDPDLNETEYDGVPLPVTNPSSPFGGSRAVALDTFPMNIVGGAQVIETNEPDMNAESLGGTVNLLPRRGTGPDGKPFVDMEFGTGDEVLRSTPVVKGSVTAGGALDGWSGVITADYDDDQRGVDDLEESYADNQSAGVPNDLLNDIEFRRYQYHRRTYGLAGNLDGKITSSTTVYARLLWSGYLETTVKHYLNLNNLDGATPCTPAPSCYYSPSDPSDFYSPQTDVQQYARKDLNRFQSSVAILGGHSVLSGASLDYKGWWVLGSNNTSYDYSSQWDDPNAVPVQYSYANPDWPTFQTLDGTNPANPAIYTLTQITAGPSVATDREVGAAFDATIPIGRDSDDQVKVGLMTTLRHQTYFEQDPFWNPNGTISLAPYVYGPSQTYYDGHYDIGPAISPTGVQQLADDPTLTTYGDDAAADASLTTDDNENVYAAYGQYNGTFGKWGVLTGVRIEKTQATYRGGIYNSDADTNTRAAASESYTNAFPTLQLRYQFMPKLVGRMAFSTAIARPGFNQITPGASVSVSGANVTVGNPKLKPTIGDNLDLTLGYYPGSGQIAEVDFFGKKFTNYILLTQQAVPSYNFPGLIGVPTIVDSYSNGPANVYGVEAQYQQQLLFLPAPYSGFGLNANATIVDSKATIHPAFQGQPAVTGTLPSTSKLTWNLALFYERDPLELRIAADYVGQNLFGFGGVVGGALDDYTSPRLTLDFGSSYQIRHHMEVYFDVKNLLNAPLKYTESSNESRLIQREFYDLTLYAGLRASF